MAEATSKHPNIAIVERFFAAYARNDLDGIREVLAPDIVWRIPGHHPLAGDKRGVDEVLAFFGQLGRAGFEADALFIEANDAYVVDLHRGYSTRGPARLDILWVLAYRIQDGRIVEAANYPGDQHAADAFFWEMYPLKPLPDRLAWRPVV